MTILITGASGIFGRAAVEGLLQHMPAGEIIAMTRQPAKLADLAERGVQVRYGDFDDAASITQAAAGADKMLLISASKVGKRIPQHRNAINGAVAAGIKHIIYTSYVGKMPNPSLAVSDHRATEELLRESGVIWTVLRNTQYSDAVVEAQSPAALKSGQWISSSGDGRMAQVTRRDCIDSAVAVLTSEGHRNTVYEITGPELLTFREISQMIAELAGRPIEYIPVDDEGMYAFFDSLGIPRSADSEGVVNGFPWCSDDMTSVERALRLGCMEVISDHVKLLTGREPQSLRSFATERQDDLRNA